MKIYVASSWRNEDQPRVIARLRAEGHEVYDFKNPRPGDHGFHWRDVGLADAELHHCPPERLRAALAHPRALESFVHDSGAMRWAEACVLVLPAGRSAHLEAGWMAGWMAGQGKRVVALAERPIEPELMYGLLEKFCTSLDEVVEALREEKGDRVAHVSDFEDAIISLDSPAD